MVAPWGPSFRSPPLRCRPAGSGFRRPGLSDRQSAHRIHCVPIYGLCTKGFVEEYPIFRQRSDRLNRWQCRTESLPRDILHGPYLQNGSYAFVIGADDTDRVGVIGREHNGETYRRFGVGVAAARGDACARCIGNVDRDRSQQIIGIEVELQARTGNIVDIDRRTGTARLTFCVGDITSRMTISRRVSSFFSSSLVPPSDSCFGAT